MPGCVSQGRSAMRTHKGPRDDGLTCAFWLDTASWYAECLYVRRMDESIHSAGNVCAMSMHAMHVSFNRLGKKEKVYCGESVSLHHHRRRHDNDDDHIAFMSGWQYVCYRISIHCSSMNKARMGNGHWTTKARRMLRGAPSGACLCTTF